MKKIDLLKLSLALYGAAYIAESVSRSIKKIQAPRKPDYVSPTNKMMNKRIKELKEQQNYDFIFRDIVKNNPDLY